MQNIMLAQQKFKFERRKQPETRESQESQGTGRVDIVTRSHQCKQKLKTGWRKQERMRWLCGGVFD